MQTNRINPKGVYGMGVSAGADMATIMGAPYPALYAAIAPAAGCAYLTCADVTGAAAYTAMGDYHREVPAFIDQGTADMLNNFALGETAERQWVGTNDFADDGSSDASVALTSSESYGLDPTITPGDGDPCVAYARFPCLGGAVGLQGSYPYTINHYTDVNGCGVVDFFIVHGLNHAYPGGDPQGTFVDPLGPDLTKAAWSFFKAHPMGACGT